jgi:hypothetical protein
MRRKQTWFKNALAFAALTASLWAQTQTADNKVPSNPASKPATNAAATPAPITAADIQSLKDAIAAQQQEIEELKQQLLLRTVAVPAAGAKAPEATPAMAAAPTTTAAPATAPAGLDAAAIEGVSAPHPQQPVQQSEMQPNSQPEEGPLTIHFRGINVTPGGYAEGAFVRRSRALGADLPTPFNSLTMPGASQSQMSEFFGSGRQSKITTFVDGRLKGVDLSSYVSADFLSSGISSNSNQTDSYTLRLRQAWGQAKFDNGFSFLAGQAWSLVTENGASIAPDDDLGRTNDARPKTIDPSYNVGFVFSRQFGWRVTQKFNDKFAIAVAMENAQGTLTTHGNGNNFLLGSAGSGSGAYNSGITTCTASYYPPNTTDLITTCTPAAPYTFNPAPDLIVKAAFDPGFGHYEVFALYDRFRDRVFPCGEIAPPTPPATNGPCPLGVAGNGPSALDAYNVSKNGGAFGASARFTFLKGLTFGVKGFGGSGVGRYGPAGLPDLAIRASGEPYLIKNLMGLSTLEWNGKKLSVYAYTGAEYAGRATSYDPIINAYVGYGSPFANNSGCSTEQPPLANGGFLPASLSKCTGDTRVVIEGTGGFWYKFFSGPQGSFRYGIQYSYVTRNTWSGANGLQPHGIDGMIFSSFRYYLP